MRKICIFIRSCGSVKIRCRATLCLLQVEDIPLKPWVRIWVIFQKEETGTDVHNWKETEKRALSLSDLSTET